MVFVSIFRRERGEVEKQGTNVAMCLVFTVTTSFTARLIHAAKCQGNEGIPQQAKLTSVMHQNLTICGFLFLSYLFSLFTQF